MDVAIRPMTIEDYDSARALWARTEGVALSPSDEREPIGRFLARNPGMSFVALDGERLVGTILASHDGRRGYLSHLAVDEACRRRGIGGALVEAAAEAIRREGLIGCNLFIWKSNAPGRAFWESHGWHEPDTWVVMNRRFDEETPGPTAPA